MFSTRGDNSQSQARGRESPDSIERIFDPVSYPDSDAAVAALPRTQRQKPTPQKKQTVIKAVERWKKLLFSEKRSDIQFVFPDGAILHAHTNILAVASPYFDAYFDGPWGENHPDGVWQTTNSLPIMKAILSYIYIGDLLPMKALDVQSLINTLPLAQEYQMPDLESMVEGYLKSSLSIGDLKDILSAAHLYQLPSLKKACYNFICNDWSHALFAITSIESEDKEFWEEIKTALQEQEESKGKRGGKFSLTRAPKRPRTAPVLSPSFF